MVSTCFKYCNKYAAILDFKMAATKNLNFISSLNIMTLLIRFWYSVLKRRFLRTMNPLASTYTTYHVNQSAATSDFQMGATNTYICGYLWILLSKCRTCGTKNPMVSMSLSKDIPHILRSSVST